LKYPTRNYRQRQLRLLDNPLIDLNIVYRYPSIYPVARIYRCIVSDDAPRRFSKPVIRDRSISQNRQLMNDTAREFGNCEASRDYEFD